MRPRVRFEFLFTRREIQTLSRLDSPARIQSFLADLHYSADDFYRSPRRVLKDREAQLQNKEEHHEGREGHEGVI